MSKAVAILAAILSAGTLSALAETPAQPTPPPMAFRSVSIELPADEGMFPGGKAAEAINANCLACHSAGMVFNQPTLTKATWDAEVRKMIAVYKAPVAAEDIPAIVAYLDATQGAK